MPSNKPRLYIAFYARGGAPVMPGREDTYHWALLVGPKKEVEGGKGKKYHAKEIVDADNPAVTTWVFDEESIPLYAAQMLLARILIGKVENPDQLANILRNVPCRAGKLGWNCVAWVKEALETLEFDGKTMGTSVLNWSTVRDAAMRYAQEKKDQHRWDGKANFDITKVATYDLLEGKEIIP